jgi:hypothetical protein
MSAERYWVQSSVQKKKKVSVLSSKTHKKVSKENIFHVYNFIENTVQYVLSHSISISIILGLMN